MSASCVEHQLIGIDFLFPPLSLFPLPPLLSFLLNLGSERLKRSFAFWFVLARPLRWLGPPPLILSVVFSGQEDPHLSRETRPSLTGPFFFFSFCCKRFLPFLVLDQAVPRCNLLALLLRYRPTMTWSRKFPPPIFFLLSSFSDSGYSFFLFL